jgi:general stress protein 26
MKKNISKKQILKFGKESKIAIFCTLFKGVPYTRPMLIAKLDEDFTIWYATSIDSQKIQHLHENKITCTTINDLEKQIQIIGEGEIITDKEVKALIWAPEWIIHWPLKENDPDYVLIKITPQKVNYTENKNVIKVL